MKTMATWNGISPVKPSSVDYFYGRITRDEAEELLADRKCVEGMYVLRESINPLGNYNISVCHQRRVHHYVIEKQTDGMFMIPAGKKFPGPVELIEHHRSTKDGIVTQLTVGCNRQPNQLPVAFRGMTYNDLEEELLRKADSIKGVDKTRALGAQREHLVILVAKDLHQKQPWYHGKISREESEKRLKQSRHKDGKFLVRLRDDKKSFAICINFRSDTRHYLIEKNQDNKFGIQDGPKFDCIMMLVDHYHNKQDGLLCKLTEPCPSPGFNPKKLEKYMECNIGNREYFHIGSRLGPAPPIPDHAGGQPDTPPPVPPSHHRPSLSGRKSKDVSRRGLPPLPGEPHMRMMTGGIWDEESKSNTAFDSRRGLLEKMDADKLEKVYGSLPRTLADFDLKREQIEIQEELGSGQFGSVCKGMCTLKSNEKVPVAIKTLKNVPSQPLQEPELIKEAKIMMPLSHKHIVRMIGLCKSDSIMLVLELAPLGQLNSYLKNHLDMTHANIVELLWQVAMGMEYLESMSFVHRDLAARNVLLVSEHFAKISDFGMSRALSIDNNYYEAQTAGKWPLKWYAPECVYYWKFDSRSDVWSYGVTMWEALTYGKKPYEKMKGQEILKFIVEEGKRLPMPDRCDSEVYQVMLSCWEYEKMDRPSFADLAAILKNISERLRSEIYEDYIRKSVMYIDLNA